MAKSKKKAAKKKVTTKSPKKKSASPKKKAPASTKKNLCHKKEGGHAGQAEERRQRPPVAPRSLQTNIPSEHTCSAPSPTAHANRSKSDAKKDRKGKRKPLPFSVSDYVVYPTHGVGKITAIEDREVSGIHLEMFVVEFEKDKMILRVPVGKVETTGMRKLATPKVMDDAMTTLKGRARIKRTMWSRRAQEYEAKINSGDPISIAEVVRDLHRNANQPEQSYSERQIYEAALDRLVREVAAVDKTRRGRRPRSAAQSLQAA